MVEQKEHAIVVGAGIGGLLTARVLAESYEQVTLVDRDDVAAPSERPGQARKGVPQGRHAHALLSRGQQVMEELLPGLRAELLAGGAPEGDALADLRLIFGGQRLPRGRSGLRVISTSRAHLERSVSGRVLQIPRVAVRGRCDAVGLIGDGHRVRGLRVVDRAPGSAAEVMEADLVVDASGRGSRLPAWLRGIGVPVGSPEKIPVSLGYTSCRFLLDRDVLNGDIGIICGPSGPAPRTAALARLENDEWLLTVGGFGHDRPPLDIPGLLRFVAALPCGRELIGALEQGEQLTDPVPFRFPQATRTPYERAALPAGLLVVGDAACSQDPVYGQGMTVAALQARALQTHLRRGSGRRDAQARMAAASRPAWVTSRAADLALPGPPERLSPMQRAANAYLAHVLSAAARDIVVATGFLRVTGLVDAPTALLRPRIVLAAMGSRFSRALPHDSGRRHAQKIGLTTRLIAATLMVPAATVAVGLTGITVALRNFVRTRSGKSQR